MKKIATLISIGIIAVCIESLIRVGYSIWPIILIGVQIIKLTILHTKSLLEAANILFFQWLFIRLTKCRERIVKAIAMHNVSIMPNNQIEIDGNILDQETHEWYSIQYFVLPLSGWYNRLVFLNKKPKFIRIRKKSVINE